MADADRPDSVLMLSLPCPNPVGMMQVEPGEGVPSSRLTRKNLMTAVGNHKQMLLGQRVRLEGHWIKHPKYGYQMQVRQPAAPLCS